MRADIIPFLARAAGVDMSTAAESFDRMKVRALSRNGGRDDSRAFVLAVEAFRAKHPFDLGALTMDRGGHGGATPASQQPE